MHTTLTTRRLGTTDMEITTVGFGAWAIGGGGWAFGWGPQDDDAVHRHHPPRRSSAASTGSTRRRSTGWATPRRSCGRALEEHARRASGPTSSPSAGWCGTRRDRMASPRQVLRPESIRRECEASLRRLGVERIDLYQFHWPDETGTPVEDSWAEMVAAGGARARCARPASPTSTSPLLERCEAIRHVDSLQPPFSLIRRQAAEARDPLVRRARHRRHRLQPDAVGPPHRPLQRGAGAGTARRTTGAAARPTSTRRSSAAISRCATRSGRSPSATAPRVAAIAIAWTLAWPGSPARSSARARRSRWTAGSTPARSSSTRDDLDEIAESIERPEPARARRCRGSRHAHPSRHRDRRRAAAEPRFLRRHARACGW